MILKGLKSSFREPSGGRRDFYREAGKRPAETCRP
jgi:hypothetical protein